MQASAHDSAVVLITVRKIPEADDTSALAISRSKPSRIPFGHPTFDVLVDEEVLVLVLRQFESSLKTAEFEVSIS